MFFQKPCTKFLLLQAVNKQSIFIIKGLQRLGIALLVYTCCRLLFWIFNFDFFKHVSILDFIWGIRFDLSAIAYTFLPLILLHFLPFSLSFKHSIENLNRILFGVSVFVSMLLNTIDFEFYQFSMKRSTADLLDILSLGDDFSNIWFSYVTDYWNLVVLIFFFVFAADWLYKKTMNFNVEAKTNYWLQIPLFISMTAATVIASRGGLQLRPISAMTAAQHTTVNHIPIVLNTPFTFFRTMGKKGVEKLDYFDDEFPNDEFSIQMKTDTIKKVSAKNVVLFIMESYSKEYIGWYNQGKGFTPFLDSLMNNSLVFENMYANGQKSIEALPSIISGFPALMNEPYITSVYSNNALHSITEVLKNHGYTSLFFHGGSNGTMGFNGFTGAVGYDVYSGRDEYPNPEDDDGHWGIYDEPYFQFVAGELNQQTADFFATIFSLSSHHPYPIPDKYENKFESGKLPIHKSIQYADYSLKQFFAYAKNQAWYNNTVFLITADHTSQSIQNDYQNSLGIFSIPLIIYSPADSMVNVSKKVVQQCDIFPSIIDMLGMEEELWCFGKSVFDNNNPGLAVNISNGIYQIISAQKLLQFNGEETIGYYDLELDPEMKNNLYLSMDAQQSELERTMKAILQQYNNRLINNALRE